MRCNSAMAFFWMLGVALVTCSCASQTERDAVLEEVRAEVEAEAADDSVSNTSMTRLSQLLEAQGYQGVGLQYESEKVLALLTEVFSDSAAQKRKIQLIYTGVEISYDSRYQSLTIPGTSDKAKILTFIKEHVPARSAPAKP